MNYNETIKCVDLALKSGCTPILVGDRGIGKTVLAKDYAKANKMSFIHIDGNLLKEGEIKLI